MTVLAHRISIDRLATRVRIGSSDPLRAQGRLQPVLTELMPRAFAEAADRLLQDRNEVIRIRKLILRLDDPQAAEGSELADLMSRALTDALTRALSERPREAVRVWPDRAAYRASFALWRLGLAREPDWAFPEFAAYTTLTGPQAAMAVLAGSGATGILALAQQLRSLGLSAADMELRLGSENMSALLDDCHSLQVSSDVASVMHSALTRVVTAWIHIPGKTAPLARAMAALLDSLTDTNRATSSTIADVPTLARVALALAAISEVQLGKPAPEKLRDSLLAGKVPTGLSAGTPQSALRQLLRYRILRKPLADFSAGELVEFSTTDRSTMPAADEPRTASPTNVTASHLAGFALILPLIQRLRLDKTGPPETLRAIAHTALGLSATDLDSQDPGLAILVPADPGKVPVLPDAPPAANLWYGTGSLGGAARHTAASSLDLWADLWLATFAGQLPGLQDSSAAYLRRQFLYCAGTIHIDSRRITVSLTAPPLGIVLRMAGLLGSRGALPHLDNRTLVIVAEPVR